MVVGSGMPLPQSLLLLDEKKDELSRDGFTGQCAGTVAISQ